MNLLDTRVEKNNLVGKFISDIVLQILSFVAENERNNIRQRQAEGIMIAKSKGVRFGRPSINLSDDLKFIFYNYYNKKLNYKQAIIESKLSNGSFYKYYKIFLNEHHLKN